MGYMLLYTLQGSDSVSGSYIHEAPIPLITGIDRGSQRI